MFLIPNDAWEVRKTKGKGRGLFATKNLPAGSVIGDYLGKVIRTAEEDVLDDKKNFYLMYYHDYASIFPDLKKSGVHLLNHSCTPNIWMYTYRGHTLFFAIRHIFPDEELTVSYLMSPQRYCTNCTHYCVCGGAICFQTMHLSEKRHEAWWAFHEKEEAKTKRMRVQYGKNLPPLDSYPQSIPDEPIYVLFGAKDERSVMREDIKLPSKEALRKTIRETGRTIAFPKIHQRVIGIMDNLIFSESLR